MHLFARPFVVDVAMTTMTLATKLRMAAVITGVATALIGLVLWYRRGRDHYQASTLRRFVLPAVVSITGAVLAAVGTTLTFAPPESEAFARSAKPSDTTPPPTRSEGSVVLTDGHAIDLDSRDADWNISPARYVHFGEKLDLRLFTLLDVHIGIAEVAPAAGYLDCANSTGRRSEIAHDAFSAGDTFCVETDEGRWARIAVTAKQTDSSNATRVKLNVVVWERTHATP